MVAADFAFTANVATTFSNTECCPWNPFHAGANNVHSPTWKKAKWGWGWFQILGAIAAVGAKYVPGNTSH